MNWLEFNSQIFVINLNLYDKPLFLLKKTESGKKFNATHIVIVSYFS